ncbi:transglycosylase SLT domain-containing protein [Entomobacter blattae]|uniref:Membrane-bound lytic murein transglycosylase C n=1 Tax=Entomobacter blattae TaxID=2762277 RepID=A0A7H1NPZ8_9PROT|nr:transglycosylase SLT domain-containing protein [Entomobacter blattae]QNT77858.1 Membrane-bound lytic murein transglycosylase C [Entomobacter blattae]
MKRIHQNSPSQTARAFLIGAAFLAGAALTPLRAAAATPLDSPHEETAFAFAPASPDGGGTGIFPRPLSVEDSNRIKLIFTLHRSGKFSQAEQETKSLHSNLLIGDILADRYLNKDYHSSSAQLQAWLKLYGELPDAPDIFSTYLKTNPKDSAKLSPPQAFLHNTDSTPTPDEDTTLLKAFKRSPQLDKTIKERTATGPKGIQSAVHLVETTPNLSPLYALQLHAELAQSLFTEGETKAALELAQNTFLKSRQKIGLAAYVAGLAEWKQKNLSQAKKHFENAFYAETTSAAIRTGSAFWVARTFQHLGNKEDYLLWLKRAATNSDSFYGLLAKHILTEGSSNLTAKSKPVELVLGEIDIEALKSLSAGMRFFALMQVGEKEKAEATLRRLWPQISTNIPLCHSLQLIAHTAGLTDLATQLKAILSGQNSASAALHHLPLPPLKPKHGYRVNPALVYALTRVESNFNPSAFSNAGAHGLMQLTTISFQTVAHNSGKSVASPTSREMFNPEINLEFGQLYLIYLSHLVTNQPPSLAALQNQASSHPAGGGELIHTLASYNAGPTALAHWDKQIHEPEDPFLFIESIPATETREYVQKSLAYLWQYSYILALPSPSLKALSKEKWPSFKLEHDLAFHPSVQHIADKTSKITLH